MLEQKSVVEDIRKIFYQVLINNNPDKFQTRLKACREFSLKLKLQFSSVDTIYRIQNALEMFFEKTIIDHLNSEFDKLADTFYEMTTVQNPDIKGVVSELQTLSGLKSEVEIEKIVDEVVNTPDKANHKIIQSIRKQK